MKVHALQQKGYQLLHDGLLELTQVERNGIRVDVPRLKATQERLRKEIGGIRRELMETKNWRVWKRHFGDKAKLTSKDQLRWLLFEELGLESDKLTDSGKQSVDDEVLQNIDDPFVKRMSTLSKYEKVLGTFLKGIESELVGDRIHPSHMLHTTRTFRSSVSSPNLQNMPVRDKEISQIARSVFIPSPGNCMPENDFKGVEVSVSACVHHDQNFISYITTPGKDMHRDMAAQIYKLAPEAVSKETRYGAKNKFVFPQFYGDYYIACARNLWEWIGKAKLTTPEGTCLYQHLKTKGIHSLGKCDPELKPVKGTFEFHLKEVENDFWNNRFRRYGQWRREWYNDYLEKGYFDLLTGFRISGAMGRNAVTNYPIQGPAAHCLIWTLIQVGRKLRKYRMKSMIINQIHDSMIGDTPTGELRNYFEIIEETVTQELRKAWDWIIVPLEIEYELVPEGGNWFEKGEVKFKSGQFQHPTKPGIFTRNTEAFLKLFKTKKD